MKRKTVSILWALALVFAGVSGVHAGAPPPPPTALPEPATLILLGAGVAGLIGAGVIRRKK